LVSKIWDFGGLKGKVQTFYFKSKQTKKKKTGAVY